MSLLITSTIPGTTVDTLTLSTQQAELARSRATAAGLSDRIRVHLMDYRNMPPEWEGAFDRLVSVEMVEAVGKEYMEVRLGTYVRVYTCTDPCMRCRRTGRRSTGHWTRKLARVSYRVSPFPKRVSPRSCLPPGIAH